MSTDEIYEVVGWTLSIVAVVGFFAGCIIWWIHDTLHPEQAETVPMDDLLGGQTEYPESFVLHSGEDDMGGQLCFDCGEEAGMHMPWAVSVQSSAVVLIEAALCFGCALVETSTETEEAE